MKILSMDKKQREINIRSGKRNESMERYVIFNLEYCLKTAFNIYFIYLYIVYLADF